MRLEAELKKMGGHTRVSRPEKKERSYNVRKFKDYPKPRSKDTGGRRAMTRNTLPVTDYKIANMQYCPSCGGALPDTGSQYGRNIIDIQEGMACHTQWIVMRYYCKNCQAQQSAKIPNVLEGQRYGIGVMGRVAVMRCIGLSFEKISEMFVMMHGLYIARSTLIKMCNTTTMQLLIVYYTLLKEILQSDAIHCDETGWFLDGKHYWAWALTIQDAVFFHLAPTRARAVADALLADYAGIIISDSYSGWNTVGNDHQRCLLHYFRDMYHTKDKNDSKEFQEFFEIMHALLKDIMSASDARQNGSLDDEVIQTLRKRIKNIECKEYKDADCKRYSKRLKREGDQLLTCLTHDVDYHNNKSEQALRPFALLRKINYGSRSESGLQTTEVLETIHSTCKMRGVNTLEFICDFLNGKVDKIPMPAEPIVCTS